ncbi:EAL domain, c-di-GMP-specific phosphodiesterase class I (or its enzymatically inactive variant) [Gulbenkiania indica]|uniref:EAL domain, c-di-GMP-specific phosphodiesterase class I (Or its enzymatically inactive variant) n=1 Tax=Gulbenkiania indica TaxID=375574 RepID=A0A0K6GTR8_9NEIS|nr:EAL domain-containing protein [Gulbenkiania indica]CUA81931.1 EAL domain, c-di-GMP-specific phosphodiesterase class I (or its enzymatically inactive variant) [Gulbenkiania indica]
MSSPSSPSVFAGLQLDSHFQPIYSLAHRRTVGLEALLRARLDDTPLAPLEAYARTSGPAERHAFDLSVCAAHAARFAARQAEQCWLFLNIDASSLATPEAAEALIATLKQAGLAPSNVVLEVLEHVLEVDERLIEGVRRVKEAGFLIAIDDFGVGHSNLDRVCQLEPDLVKFDRHLLRSAVTQPRTRNLLSRLVHLMHEIGALVVEEGIETETDVLVALESGCDLVQGYFIGRPGAEPDSDVLITPRIDARWDELMVRDLLKRKITRRQVEIARQAFVQTAISLMQGTPFAQAATPVLALPDAIRCFLLDGEGRQIGRNLDTFHAPPTSHPKFSPLADTTGAVWSRRAYFQHAIDQPGVLYMSEPYLSMTDTRSCVTLSMAIEIDEALHVLCADVLAPRTH